jgi:hypothetical protein
MGPARWARLYLCMVGAACAALGAIACGDDGEAQSSLAKEPPEAFAARTAKLLETIKGKKACGPLNAINGRSVTRLPCPPPKALRKSMASFKITGAEEHGTGAVVDYKSGAAKAGAAILLFVDPKKQWSISRFGVKTDPAVGTSDRDSRKGFDTTVDGYLKAVRERDCDAYFKHAITKSQDKPTVCKGEFAATGVLAKRMKRDAKARPEYLGGNETYGFYSLETTKPNPPSTVTISVMRLAAKPKPRFAVLDIAASSSSSRG